MLVDRGALPGWMTTSLTLLLTMTPMTSCRGAWQPISRGWLAFSSQAAHHLSVQIVGRHMLISTKAVHWDREGCQCSHSSSGQGFSCSAEPIWLTACH